MHWTVGRVKITKIAEITSIGGSRFILPQGTPEPIQAMPWLVPQYATQEGRLKLTVQSWIVETPSHKIVVDTCIGNDTFSFCERLVCCTVVCVASHQCFTSATVVCFISVGPGIAIA